MAIRKKHETVTVPRAFTVPSATRGILFAATFVILLPAPHFLYLPFKAYHVQSTHGYETYILVRGTACTKGTVRTVHVPLLIRLCYLVYRSRRLFFPIHGASAPSTITPKRPKLAGPLAVILSHALFLSTRAYSTCCNNMLGCLNSTSKQAYRLGSIWRRSGHFTVVRSDTT